MFEQGQVDRFDLESFVTHLAAEHEDDRVAGSLDVERAGHEGGWTAGPSHLGHERTAEPVVVKPSGEQAQTERVARKGSQVTRPISAIASGMCTAVSASLPLSTMSPPR